MKKPYIKIDKKTKSDKKIEKQSNKKVTDKKPIIKLERVIITDQESNAYPNIMQDDAVCIDDQADTEILEEANTEEIEDAVAKERLEQTLHADLDELLDKDEINTALSEEKIKIKPIIRKKATTGILVGGKPPIPVADSNNTNTNARNGNTDVNDKNISTNINRKKSHHDLVSINTNKVSNKLDGITNVSSLTINSLNSIHHEPIEGPKGYGKYIFYPTADREYQWLNDTSYYEISVQDLTFPTIEHYYIYMKFIYGLPQPIDKTLAEKGYHIILEQKAVNHIKDLTSETGPLRQYMTNFKNSSWNREKDRVLYYGRMQKIAQHPELKKFLKHTGSTWIIRKVKTPGKIPLDKLSQFLGSAVYYDDRTNKWYGGSTYDSTHDSNTHDDSTYNSKTNTMDIVKSKVSIIKPMESIRKSKRSKLFNSTVDPWMSLRDHIT